MIFYYDEVSVNMQTCRAHFTLTNGFKASKRFQSFFQRKTTRILSLESSSRVSIQVIFLKNEMGVALS